jgi:hypothetical protein
MAKSQRKPTFADLAQQPTWSETDASRSGRHALRPGQFNAAGEFFDPAGVRLRLVVEDASEADAQTLVESGALVAAEECGCGGSYGDCAPEWVTPDQLRALRQGQAPRFTGRHGTPTWIDVWTNDHSTVVFAHGDVAWGAALT